MSENIHEQCNNTIATLEAQLKSKHDAYQELLALSVLQKDEIDTLNAVNEELSAKVDELSEPKSFEQAVEKIEKPVVLPKEAFAVGERKFKFNAAVFMYGGKRITAENALQDEKLLAELVDKKLGVITEVK